MKAVMFNNRGIQYLLTGQGTKSFDCFKQSLELQRDTEDVVGMAIAQNNKAVMCLKSTNESKTEEALTAA